MALNKRPAFGSTGPHGCADSGIQPREPAVTLSVEWVARFTVPVRQLFKARNNDLSLELDQVLRKLADAFSGLELGHLEEY